MIADLRGDEVEAQDGRGGEADQGGAAEDGIDADDEPDGDAPGELFRGRSHAEQREDGKRNAAIEPAVMW